MSSESSPATVIRFQDTENNKVVPESSRFPGILKAARNFNHEILQDLLREDSSLVSNAVDQDTGRSLLHLVLENGFMGHLNEDMMLKCLRILLTYGADVNAKDAQGQTPLALAVENGFQECSRVLIMDYKATYELQEATAIALTMPDLLVEIFDNGVSLTDDDLGNPMVRLDWRPILQFGSRSKEETKEFKYIQKDTQFLYNLLDVSETPVKKRYLTHPLLEAFLHFKNERFVSRFWILYAIAVIYPLVYMVFIYFLYFKVCAFHPKEVSEVGEESSSPSPTQTTPENVAKRKVSCEITVAISVCSYALALIIGVWGGVEIYMQLRVDRKYLMSWRTWVIRLTIVVMGVTLWPGLQFKDVYNITFQYPIASIGIFLSWVLFLVQVGSHKRFSIYLEMLVRILLSVLKITIMFLPLFIGFFMGFNLMFDNMEGIFSYIMMTVDIGSVAYDTLIEDTREQAFWFEILAYTFCGGFVVIIVVVFMNFLLALSIKDVDTLKGQAKVASAARQISNLFMMDLLDPYSTMIPKDGRDKDEAWTYTYHTKQIASKPKCALPNDIQAEFINLLKRKKLQKSAEQVRLQEKVMFEEAKNPTEEMLRILMKRIEDMEQNFKEFVSNVTQD